jgi:DNA-binding GntR family transcriptional regulator
MAIEHPTLSKVVADSLRKLIASGKLAPGSRLNERELCDQLKVSRTPLREAYRILSAEGLVELTPKHGARVIQLSEDDVANIFDVLAMAEGLSGRLATERASEEKLAAIVHLHDQMMAAYKKRDMVRYAIAAKGTHDAINAAADNPTLRDIYLRLNAQVQKLRYRSNLIDENWAQSIDAHERFVRALLAGDATRVEQILRDHVLVKKVLALGKPAVGRRSEAKRGGDAVVASAQGARKAAGRSPTRSGATVPKEN